MAIRPWEHSRAADMIRRRARLTMRLRGSRATFPLRYLPPVPVYLFQPRSCRSGGIIAPNNLHWTRPLGDTPSGIIMTCQAGTVVRVRVRGRVVQVHVEKAIVRVCIPVATVLNNYPLIDLIQPPAIFPISLTWRIHISYRFVLIYLIRCAFRIKDLRYSISISRS